MALQKDVFVGGTSIAVSNAYHRIKFIRIICGVSVGITIETYKNVADAASQTPITENESYYYINAENPLYDTYFSIAALGADGTTLGMSCYNYLKTLPEFDGATDV